MISYFVTYLEDRAAQLRLAAEKIEGVASVIRELAVKYQPPIYPILGAHIVRDFNLALHYAERIHNEILVELMRFRNYTALAQETVEGYAMPPQEETSISYR